VICDCPPTDRASRDSSHWEDLGGFLVPIQGFSEPAHELAFLPQEDGYVFYTGFWGTGFGFSYIGS